MPVVSCQLSEGEGLKSARECVEKAKALIAETGYHRRDPEVRYLELILSEPP